MPAAPNPTPPPAGRIDVHSHLIPGVDDGCQSVEEAVASIAMLQRAGYIGSICTPHIWRPFPENTPTNIALWTQSLRVALTERNIDYLLWTGGEVRLDEGILDWFKLNGVPTLADSRFVLCDFWEPKWPRYVDRAFDWLFENGYRPMLAHPERLSSPNLEAKLDELCGRGVLMQGNFRCMTGEDGMQADEQVRVWLTQNRYALLATDAHRPEALPSRLDGMRMVVEEYSQALVDEMTIDAPRRLIFESAQAA